MAVNKAERHLNLIAELLHTSIPLTTRDIKQRIDGYPDDDASFRRAFERDKKTLREEMGIPVSLETVPGTHPEEQGYRIHRAEYEMPDPGLEPDELAAINLAASLVRVDDDAAAQGLTKLGAGPAGRTSQTVAFLGEARDLSTVFDAIATRRRLTFGYGGDERRVDPAQLHHEKGRWYLVGFDHARDDVRNFRLDRIEGDLVVGDPGSATVDPEVRDGVNLRGWDLGDDEPVRARVQIHPPLATVAARQVDESVDVEHRDDGSVVLSFDVRLRDGFRSFVLEYLEHAEVLEPAELRDDLVAWLTAIAGEDAS